MVSMDHPLLTNYLQDRQQRVFMHNVYSEWGRITHGVPQGSVLGPLFFCLHINDLPSCIQNCKIHIFADDTSIQFFICCGFRALIARKKELNAVQAWMNANKLKLNPAKTLMLITTRQRVRAHWLNYLNLNLNQKIGNTSTVCERLWIFLPFCECCEQTVHGVKLRECLWTFWTRNTWN